MYKQMNPFYTWRSAVSSKRGPSSPTTRLVLLTLSTYMNEKTTTAFPSTRALAEDTALSRRSVETHLKKAEEEGWLRVSTHGYSGQGWKRHEYQAAVPDGAKVGKEVRQVGGERGSPRVQKGGEIHAEGGETDSKKVGKEVPLNSPRNNTKNNPSVARVRDEPNISRTQVPGVSKLVDNTSSPDDPEPNEIGLNPDRPDYAPSLSQVVERAKMVGVAPEVARTFFWHYEAQNWTDDKDRLIRRWVPMMMKWKSNEKVFAKRSEKPPDKKSWYGPDGSPRPGTPPYEEHMRRQFEIRP